MRRYGHSGDIHTTVFPMMLPGDLALFPSLINILAHASYSVTYYIGAIASALLGNDYNFMPIDRNYYAGDTRWYSDRATADILHIKIAYYLAPLSADTDVLQVIPGSHDFGDQFADSLSRDLGNSPELWGIDGNQVPGHSGDIIPGLFIDNCTVIHKVGFELSDHYYDFCMIFVY